MYSFIGCSRTIILIRVVCLKHGHHFETNVVYFKSNYHWIRDNPECNETEPIPECWLSEESSNEDQTINLYLSSNAVTSADEATEPPLLCKTKIKYEQNGTVLN